MDKLNDTKNNQRVGKPINRMKRLNEDKGPEVTNKND